MTRVGGIIDRDSPDGADRFLVVGSRTEWWEDGEVTTTGVLRDRFLDLWTGEEPDEVLGWVLRLAREYYGVAAEGRWVRPDGRRVSRRDTLRWAVEDISYALWVLREREAEAGREERAEEIRQLDGEVYSIGQDAGVAREFGQPRLMGRKRRWDVWEIEIDESEREGVWRERERERE